MDAEYKHIFYKLADSGDYKEIISLAESIFKKVCDANSAEIVFGAMANPEIKKECDEFREKIKALGFPAPELNSDLYEKIIKPLIIYKTNRAA